MCIRLVALPIPVALRAVARSPKSSALRPSSAPGIALKRHALPSDIGTNGQVPCVVLFGVSHHISLLPLMRRSAGAGLGLRLESVLSPWHTGSSLACATGSHDIKERRDSGRVLGCNYYMDLHQRCTGAGSVSAVICEFAAKLIIPLPIHLDHYI